MANRFQFTADGDTNTFKAQIDDSGKNQILRVLNNSGTIFLDIRDWFTTSDGLILPTKRGVRLTVDEWKTICSHHENISYELLKWNSRLRGVLVPVLSQTNEAEQPALVVNENLKLYDVPASLAPNAKNTDTGTRVVIEKLSTTTLSAANPKKTSVSITPMTWYRLMMSHNRQEIDAIITTMRSETEATLARKKLECVAAEAVLQTNMDLSQL